MDQTILLCLHQNLLGFSFGNFSTQVIVNIVICSQIKHHAGLQKLVAAMAHHAGLFTANAIGHREPMTRFDNFGYFFKGLNFGTVLYFPFYG